MIQTLFGIFIVLHGLVHFLYFGQSARYFELQPGMSWPDGSWSFSRFLPNTAGRKSASILLVLAGIGFLVGGAGIFLKQGWWLPVVTSTAIFSSLIYVLFWDGKIQSLHDKGGVGILINLALLTSLFVFHWPKFKF